LTDTTFRLDDTYEKLRNQLSKLRRKTQNEQKGIVDLQGRGKVSGRKSMLESNPELIKHVKELKSGSYTNQEVLISCSRWGIGTPKVTRSTRHKLPSSIDNLGLCKYRGITSPLLLLFI